MEAAAKAGVKVAVLSAAATVVEVLVEAKVAVAMAVEMVVAEMVAVERVVATAVEEKAVVEKEGAKAASCSGYRSRCNRPRACIAVVLEQSHKATPGRHPGKPHRLRNCTYLYTTWAAARVAEG